MSELSRAPLNALRAFDAAARLGSFLEAAKALSVTPGAVSQHIRALEHRLGVRLFDRFNRAVRLTAAGEQLAADVADAFARLDAALARLKAEDDGPLMVSATPSVAVRWLAPRLPAFLTAFPGEEVRISAEDRPVNLAAREADVAIRYGPGPYPGLLGEPLLPGDMFPVCTPEVAAKLRTLDDLAGAVLLDGTTAPELQTEPDWPAWLRAAGVASSRRPTISYSHFHMSVAAAATGQGVALSNIATAVDDLEAGRLVRPFEFVLTNPNQHWMLCLPERADQPRLRRFLRWLAAEAEKTRAAVQVSQPIATPVSSALS